jgi:hypothetical protein
LAAAVVVAAAGNIYYIDDLTQNKCSVVAALLHQFPPVVRSF